MGEIENYSFVETRRSPRRLALSEIDLIEVAKDVWGGRRVTGVLLVLAVVLAILSVTFAKPSYTATATIAPADNSAQRSGGLGQYAAAASALGINMNDADGSYFAKYKEALDSNSLAAALLKRDDLRELMFGPGWDPKTKMFKRPTGMVFNIKEFLKGLLGMHQWSQPSTYEARVKLKSALTVTSEKLTSFVNLSVVADSPEHAKRLLSTIMLQADDLLRQAAKERAANRINYLNQALARTTLQDQREAIISVLSTQQKNMMMASVDRTFAMEIIDPPTAQPYPTSPNARVTLVIYAFVALTLGMFTAIFHGQKSRWRQYGDGYTEEFDAVAVAYIRYWLSLLRSRIAGAGGGDATQDN